MCAHKRRILLPPNDAKLVLPQSEHTKLHQMLKEVQEQNNQRLLAFEKERHELNTRIADLQQKLDQKATDLSTAQSQFSKERSEFRATYEKLKQHMSQNTERFVKPAIHELGLAPGPADDTKNRAFADMCSC